MEYWRYRECIAGTFCVYALHSNLARKSWSILDPWMAQYATLRSVSKLSERFGGLEIWPGHGTSPKQVVSYGLFLLLRLFRV